MIVTIEGVITSKELKTKVAENQQKIVNTELLVAQPGEKVQAAVRLDGDVLDNYEIFEKIAITGQLLTWKTRDGVGMMVKVNGN